MAPPEIRIGLSYVPLSDILSLSIIFYNNRIIITSGRVKLHTGKYTYQ